MYNAAVKTVGRYTLKIVRDDDADNPREAYDNFCKMACWHRRYYLGDKHDYSEPTELLKDLVRETVSNKELIAYVKVGKAADLVLEYNKSGREWELKSHDTYFKKWYTEWSSPPPLNDNGYALADCIRDNMASRNLMELVKGKHIIQPLYLLDHGGISISTQDFRDRWDSGQVGWIYASHADIAKEFGDASPENITRAEKLLNGEVETYDCYLRGECYGFQLYKDGEEVDSGWGFLGSFVEAKAAIREYVLGDAVTLADDVEYGDHDPEYDPDNAVGDEMEDD